MQVRLRIQIVELNDVVDLLQAQILPVVTVHVDAVEDRVLDAKREDIFVSSLSLSLNSKSIQSKPFARRIKRLHFGTGIAKQCSERESCTFGERLQTVAALQHNSHTPICQREKR
jgi:hypothetical protein